MTSNEYATLQKVLKILFASGMNSKAVARSMIAKLIKEHEEREKEEK